VALLFALLALLLVVALPPLAYRSVDPPDFHSAKLTDKERFDIQTTRLQMQGALRQTLIQALAVLATLSGAALAWRQAHQQREEKRQDFQLQLFNGAMEALASESRAVRIGGIYSLSGLAEISKEHRVACFRVLDAFLREGWPWPPVNDSQPGRDASIKRPAGPNSATHNEDARAALLALVELGRRRHEELGPLMLQQLDLRQHNLPDADLEGADLKGSQLTGSWMPRVRIRNANLTSADLREVHLVGADLTGSILNNADFTGSDLSDVIVDPADRRLASNARWPRSFVERAT
jgi:hypothetical protein